MNWFRCLIILFFPSIFLLSSCEEGGSIESVSQLSFSVDTVSFGYVFTGVNSITKTISVKNNSKDDIIIDNIKLNSSDNSVFVMNFDGENGTSFDNVKINAKDSLFLFIKFSSENGKSTEVTKNEDKIFFNSKPNSKFLVLEANSLDAEVLKGIVIDKDTTFNSDYPFLVYDSLYVKKGATLTISAGCNFYMHDKAFVKVDGTLIVKGNVNSYENDPVVFRGDRLDNMFDNLPYDFNPGQWDGIELGSSSFDNNLKGVVIRGANYGIYIDSCNSTESKVVITNSIIHNMTNSCLVNNGAKIKVENSQLTNAGGDVVKLIGGSNIFYQCTLANYQNLINRNGVTLNFEKFYDESSADFKNTVITGSNSKEIEKDTSINTNVKFSYCAFKNFKDFNNNENCINLDNYKYNEASFLKLGNEKEDYIFYFGLDSLSILKDKGTETINYSYDLKGNKRIGLPDIGAYEYIIK